MDNNLRKENLVIVKDGVIIPSDLTNDFKPNTFYRCNPSDEGYYVNGVLFKAKLYNTIFERAYDKIMRDFEMLGLLKPSGKPITKKLFKEMADIHTYRGVNARGLYRAFFTTSKTNVLYSFKSYFRENKKTFTDFIYEQYLRLCSGILTQLDEGADLIEFGNCGIPLHYSTKLRVRNNLNTFQV